MSLEEEFNKAAKIVRELNPIPPEIDSLEFYSLYKQATVGDCNTPKKGDSKWSAWNGKKGMTQNEAKQLYIAKTKSYSG